MTKYFFIVTSKDNVLREVMQGIAQAGHGRKDFMSKPSKGAWVVYYSSKDKLEDGKVYQKFTAPGQITDGESSTRHRKKFKLYIQNVDYKVCNEADIRPLLKDLGFIKNKKQQYLPVSSNLQTDRTNRKTKYFQSFK